MDLSASETEVSSSTPNFKERTGTFILKRKFRGTNDFIVEEITDGLHSNYPENFNKKKRARQSFLPKIDDVKLTSCSLSNTSKRLPVNKIKIFKSLKLHKHKLESRRIFKTADNKIKSLKLKKAKGVWTPVKNSDTVKRDLYVPLIPLEKTNLLTRSQLKQLMPCKLDDTETEDLKDSTESLSNFYRPCSVFLKQLTTEEMNSAASMDVNDCVNLHLPDSFSPEVTSSPNIFSYQIDRQSTNTIVLPTSISANASTSLEGINKDLKVAVANRTTDNSIIQINSTFEINQDSNETPVRSVVKKLTWQDSLHLDNGNNENVYLSPNRTYEIDQTQDQKKTPKSVLKTNPRNPSNNNRRVTFNDTSIIIIHDSDTLYTSLTPTHFEAKSSDRKSFFNVKASPGRTPITFPILRSANSSQKNEDFAVKLHGSVKRTRMPDFAKIHKRMFDGMLDIRQHTEEKLKRTRLLLSGRKPNIARKTISKEHINTVTANLKKPTVKKVLKDTPNTVEHPSIKKDKLDIKEKIKNPLFRKQQVLAVANKLRPNEATSRENAKVFIKGIRSNRRFELLMNLRKNQEKQNKK